MASITAQNVTLDLPIAASNKLQASDEDRYFVDHDRALLRVLDNVSFRALAGDRVGIIGRNGSGKSTLLRVIAGIFKPNAGKVSIVGKPDCLFTVSMGMQPELSGRDNIFLRGIITGKTHQQVAAKVDEIVAFAELETFIDFPLRTYSSGMSTRLAFSISTAFSPDILLLDEWIGAGDSQFQIKAAARMQDLVSDARITVLASHNKSLITRVCNRVIWLHQGKLKAFGPTSDVLDAHDKFYSVS